MQEQLTRTSVLPLPSPAAIRFPRFVSQTFVTSGQFGKERMKNAAEFIFVFLTICIALLLSPLIVAWCFFDEARHSRELNSWADDGYGEI